MKTRLTLLFLAGLSAGLLPRAVLAQDDTAQSNSSLAGMFYVAAVKGTAEVVADGRIWDLAKGDKVLARGATISVAKDAYVTIVLSNQVSMFLGANTLFRVKKFEQEPFSENNNLGLEPSNSQTVIGIERGQVLVNTPQMLSGSHLFFETPDASVEVLNDQSGSEKALVEADVRRTHVAVISGLVAVNPRKANGDFVAISTPVKSNQQAFVNHTMSGGQVASVASLNDKPAIGQVQTADVGEFQVHSVTGRVDCTSAQGAVTPLKAGDHLFASGADVTVAAGAKATLRFANEVEYTLGAGTRLRIDRFSQEPFAENSNRDPSIEPSNSLTDLTLVNGTLAIETPQLLAGSKLVIATPHSAVGLLAAAGAGDQAFLSVSPQQTQFQVQAGRASIQPRDAQGKLAQTYYMGPGQEAVVKYTLAAPGGKRLSGVQVARTVAAVSILPAPVVPAGAAVETHPVDATVLKVAGSAQFRLPGGADAVLRAGAILPQGATITTGPTGQVYFRPFVGAVSVLQPDSVLLLAKLQLSTAAGVIVKQTARLDLRKGTIVSDLDPAKRNIDDYSVQTPKGVATAHGTAFTVSVIGGDPSVTGTADAVDFTGPDGTTYTVNAGQVVMTPPGGSPSAPIPLAQAVAANPQFAGVVQTAVTTICAVVQNNIGNIPAASAANLVSQVVAVACAAVPSSASTFTSQGISAVSAPGSATTGDVSNATAAITAASNAATSGGTSTNVGGSSTSSSSTSNSSSSSSSGSSSSNSSSGSSSSSNSNSSSSNSSSSSNGGSTGNSANVSTSTSITISTTGGTGTTNAGNNGNQSTGVTVTQLVGNQSTEVTAALNLTSNAQGSVTFNTSNGNGNTGSNPTINANPVQTTNNIIVPAQSDANIP